MGKLRTRLADRVHILPTCLASCHCPRAEGRTIYIAGPRLHTFHEPLPPSTSLSPYSPRSPIPPFPSIPLANRRSRPFKYSYGSYGECCKRGQYYVENTVELCVRTSRSTRVGKSELGSSGITTDPTGPAMRGRRLMGAQNLWH